MQKAQFASFARERCLTKCFWRQESPDDRTGNVRRKLDLLILACKQQSKPVSPAKQPAARSAKHGRTLQPCSGTEMGSQKYFQAPTLRQPEEK